MQVILHCENYVLKNECLSVIELLIFSRRRNAKEKNVNKAKRIIIMVIKCNERDILYNDNGNFNKDIA